MRLPRRYSMTERRDFARVRHHGQSAPGRYVLMATLVDASLPHLKFGIIASRKTGRAVDRNKLRRRLRGILSKHGHRIDQPRFLVMVVRRKAREASFQQLEHEWLRLAGRLGILHDLP